MRIRLVVALILGHPGGLTGIGLADGEDSPQSFCAGRLIATVEGRFDSIRRGPLGWWQGYGHQGLLKRRLMLRRVIAVRPELPVLERR